MDISDNMVQNSAVVIDVITRFIDLLLFFYYYPQWPGEIQYSFHCYYPQNQLPDYKTLHIITIIVLKQTDSSIPYLFFFRPEGMLPG